MEALISEEALRELTGHFQALSSVVPLHSIRSDAELDRATTTLNQLLDAGAADEAHPLANLATTLAALIGEYEDAKIPLPQASPIESLRFLMEQHHLSQADLPELGTQGVVSELLKGKRMINVRQAKALALRFGVPAGVFI
ncbi:MAG: transcriptional regulator [Pseudomonadota bacterium]